MHESLRSLAREICEITGRSRTFGGPNEVTRIAYPPPGPDITKRITCPKCGSVLEVTVPQGGSPEYQQRRTHEATCPVCGERIGRVISVKLIAKKVERPPLVHEAVEKPTPPPEEKPLVAPEIVEKAVAPPVAPKVAAEVKPAWQTYLPFIVGGIAVIGIIIALASK